MPQGAGVVDPLWAERGQVARMTGVVALIMAAGRGVRAGEGLPKQYRLLGGVPLLTRTIQCFLDHPGVTSVRAVIDPEHRGLFDAATAGLAPAVAGGATRQESVRLGLEALAGDPPASVLIHDAARPFVDSATVDRVLEGLRSGPAAIPVVAVRDTIKRGMLDGRVDETVPRAGLFRAQTPQGFDFAAILEAHRRQSQSDFTDDAAVAEADGLPVRLVEGTEDNMKLTTQEDFARAERLLAGGREVRVGTGFDVHRFGPGDAVTLCGVSIPHSRGLAGHSDADVAMHAATDALLGALGESDIGTHFPDSDPAWRDAPSAVFLGHAAALLAERRGAVVSVDVTIICEAPRIAAHRAAMRETLARILDTVPERVNVKATTTEQLGFTGRGEGIAAQATIAISLPN